VKRRALCIATRNAHKLGEIRAVLADLGLEITSPADHPGCPDVEEDGATLEANAEKKARVVRDFTGLFTLADDSGLEVDALGGAPGVFSARYAGPGCSYSDNNAKLLRELEGVPDARRTARFRCVIALADPAPPRRVSLHGGCLEGRILHESRGAGGFGYDPIFWVPEEACTLAELPTGRKNVVSHRAAALAMARRFLRAHDT
jgi:XTP/dITP diphosphohydrolase